MKNLKTIIVILVLGFMTFGCEINTEIEELEGNHLENTLSNERSSHRFDGLNTDLGVWIDEFHVVYLNSSEIIRNLIRQYYKGLFGSFKIIRCGEDSELWILTSSYYYEPDPDLDDPSEGVVISDPGSEEPYIENALLYYDSFMPICN